MTYGPEIPHDGGAKPVWLADGEIVGSRVYEKYRADNAERSDHWIMNWRGILSFRLPADHWAYLPIAKGFTPHTGSDAAPGDWDGGAVLLRNGWIMPQVSRWRHDASILGGETDVIGYNGPVNSPSTTAPEAPASDTVPGDDIGEGNHDCLDKRRPGEPMFILLGRDPDAWRMVRLWAERRLAAGGDLTHCVSALDLAETMRKYSLNPANRPASAPDNDRYPDTVPVERMTEGEARAWTVAQIHCGDGSVAQAGAMQILRAIGAIREPDPLTNAADIIRQCVALAEAGEVIPASGLAPMRAWLDREGR